MGGKEHRHLEKPVDYKYVKFFSVIPLVIYVVEEAFIAVEDNAWRNTVFIYLLLDIVLVVLQRKYRNRLSNLTFSVVVCYWLSCIYSVTYLAAVYRLPLAWLVVISSAGFGFVVWRTTRVLNFLRETKGLSADK